MQYVEIYKLKNDGSQEVIAKCVLRDKMVKCEGDKIFVENLEKDGIRDYSDMTKPKQFFMKDGIKFLENLKFNFKSGYLNASDVMNE